MQKQKPIRAALQKARSLFSRKAKPEGARRLSEEKQKQLDTKLVYLIFTHENKRIMREYYGDIFSYPLLMRRIKRLLKAGANIEAREEHLNKTPLICAAWYGHADICKILIAKGADLEAKDNEGNTALMRAAENLHHSAVKCLISHGADVNAKDNKGENALVLVSRKWHPKLSLKTLRLLVRGGANQLGKALANAEGEAAKLLERAIIDRLERQMGRQGFALFMREFKACIAS